MRPARVLLVVGLVAGGAGRHVHELAAGLTAAGVDVLVACPPEVGEHYGFAGVAAQVVPVAIAARPDPRHDVRTVRTLTRAARDVDVVHAHGLRAAALAALAGGRTPLVATLHNAAPRGRSRHLFAGLERLVARRSAVVLAVAPDLVESARRRGARDVRPAVVNAPEPQPVSRPDRENAAQTWHSGVRALSVGRLAPQKDVDLLLDAVGLLQPDCDVEVLVAGDGPERDRLQRRIDVERLAVRLLGRRDDVPALLSAADLVVSSAQWEGQPVWLQEAIQAGTAVVATDVGGTSTVTGDAALLVPYRDAPALAEAITRCVSEAALRASLAAASRRRAEALPRRADAVRSVLGVYRELGPDARWPRPYPDPSA